ncbi:hypothetical protein L4G92_03000 [Neisseria sp. ZJ106]|uniref:Uncharacterized protein n=1 Tax=Neisseria lisongii TaxID=2912188 RepID=A0ABY7RHT1_9NEIS|nr:hypothetical protein [Neisseria lisongii]MCF7521022.1 hypothetical protein [Neisseria lisongii]WCL71177.1 hypothetical protein PJU73_07505 [Neisseria lisongii]
MKLNQSLMLAFAAVSAGAAFAHGVSATTQTAGESFPAYVGNDAEVVYYNLADSYYYDKAHNRLPREYHPGKDTVVERINTNETQTEQTTTTTYQREDGTTVIVERTVVQQPVANQQLTPSYHHQRAPIEGVRSNSYTHINGR